MFSNIFTKNKIFLAIAASFIFLICSFNISFAGALDFDDLQSIIITTSPKTEYYVGDSLDISGLVVKGIYWNDFGDEQEREVTITDPVTGFSPLTPTTGQTLTVTYSGFTTTYTVDILEAPLTSISIRTQAVKTIYTVGDNLDISGLVVCGTYVNRTPCDIDLPITTGNISGFDSSVATSSQTLTITYEGKTTSYPISIEEASSRRSGSRRQTVNSVSTAPAASLSSSNDQTYSNTSTTTSEFVFNNNLGYGMRNEDVRLLQERLRTEGFYTFHTSTGYFGPITLAAVKAYQAAHPEIGYVTGFVGPLTRAVLNK